MDAGNAVAPVAPFDLPLTKKRGIYRALSEKPDVPLAQRSNFWPLTAALYEPLWRRRSISLLTRGAFSTARELELLLTWLDPRPGERILDAGASAGLYARTLLRHTPGLEVHALDFSRPFLETARRYAKRDSVAPVLVHADVRHLPYQDAIFDAVVCGGSLNEFTDLSRTLTEFARVLKPNGKLFLMALLQSEGRPGRKIQRLLSLSGLQFFETERFGATVQTLGFSPLHVQICPPVSFSLYQKVTCQT